MRCLFAFILLSIVGSIITLLIFIFEENNFYYINQIYKFNKGYVKNLGLPDNFFEGILLNIFGTKKTKEYIEKRKGEL